MYVCMNGKVYVYECVCMYVCIKVMLVCMYVCTVCMYSMYCIYVCMYVCM